VRVLGARGGVVVCARGDVSPGAALAGLGAWVRCRAVVPFAHVPAKGAIEVWATQRGGHGLSAEETVQFTAANVAAHLLATDAAGGGTAGAGAVAGVGGDFHEWSAAVNQACSLRALGTLPRPLSLPRGYTALRALRVPSFDAPAPGPFAAAAAPAPTLTYTLSFFAKLSTMAIAADAEEGKTSGAAGAAAAGRREEQAGWGYEWCAVVVPGSGDGRDGVTAAEGMCRHVPRLPGAPPSSSSGSSSSGGKGKGVTEEPLKPWSWTPTEAALGPLYPGDMVVLCARAAAFGTTAEHPCHVQVTPLPPYLAPI